MHPDTLMGVGESIAHPKDFFMPKMMQIDENDLGELERVLPELAEAAVLSPAMSNRLRVKLRRCQRVLSNVRWNYGPATDVTTVQSDEEDHRS